jgi:hypothetical protein
MFNRVIDPAHAQAYFAAEPENFKDFGQPFFKDGTGSLTFAVHLWRYMSYQVKELPSLHDVVTGYWKPTQDEKNARLAETDSNGTPDLCTVLSLAVADRNITEAIATVGFSKVNITSAYNITQVRTEHMSTAWTYMN